MKFIEFLEELNHDYFWKEQFQAFGFTSNIAIINLMHFIQGVF